MKLCSSEICFREGIRVKQPTWLKHHVGTRDCESWQPLHYMNCYLSTLGVVFTPRLSCNPRYHIYIPSAHNLPFRKPIWLRHMHGALSNPCATHHGMHCLNTRGKGRRVIDLPVFKNNIIRRKVFEAIMRNRTLNLCYSQLITISRLFLRPCVAESWWPQYVLQWNEQAYGAIKRVVRRKWWSNSGAIEWSGVRHYRGVPNDNGVQRKNITASLERMKILKQKLIFGEILIHKACFSQGIQISAAWILFDTSLISLTIS